MAAATRRSGFDLKLRGEWYFMALNTRILTASTHSEPPEAPVSSYHCTQLWLKANRLPRLSQVQLMSQRVWMYSNASQKGMSSHTAQALPMRAFTLEKIRNTMLMSRALQINAMRAPPSEAYTTHQVTSTFQARKLR